MKNKVAHRPTGLERRLYKILDSLHMLYETEEERGPYQLDCYLTVHNIAIEADGPCHAYRRGRDRRRDEYLWNHYRIKVLRLDWRDLQSERLAACRIMAFIREWSTQCRGMRQALLRSSAPPTGPASAALTNSGHGRQFLWRATP